ncbi:hypothetical protein RhiirA5_505226 [Rhizophagus irregularis]|uniref:Uncharacterized protein n=1 Tax=Rhizophagus irregularis TaxID=588596 RepID=A0A2N0P0J6_9GLOM|nr:hypothetical protein RhiirA5_505226 [Rhizophagus irregularis]GET58461.1 hypothetical protein RIR_jg14065.t1 [Rhizophagus irregularis DAOM 181602=DAOM 197198]
MKFFNMTLENNLFFLLLRGRLKLLQDLEVGLTVIEYGKLLQKFIIAEMGFEKLIKRIGIFIVFLVVQTLCDTI